MRMQWAVIRSANTTQVIVGPFKTYEEAQAWAEKWKMNNEMHTWYRIVPFFRPKDYK